MCDDGRQHYQQEEKLGLDEVSHLLLANSLWPARSQRPAGAPGTPFERPRWLRPRLPFASRHDSRCRIGTDHLHTGTPERWLRTQSGTLGIVEEHCNTEKWNPPEAPCVIVIYVHVICWVRWRYLGNQPVSCPPYIIPCVNRHG